MITWSSPHAGAQAEEPGSGPTDAGDEARDLAQVQYIVENTVGPVLKRKTEALRPDFRKAEKDFHRHFENAKSDPRILLGHAAAASLRFRRTSDPAAKPTETDFRAFALAQTYDGHKDLVEKLFDLKVLDPAMGSGHFLVEAVDFITDELLDFLNAFPNNPVSAALDRTREAILESLRDQGIEIDDSFRRQLTDIHLLKRHVLKRCIYGVDLNPLATELAKVSLWLDAFTLGAPLSFLDHHLRTGNSLIGSSLPELEDAIHDSLFKIDESHLLRAVQNVLVVARLADATASEVAKSKQAFDEARKTLSGYGVLLDILVAKHFGHTAATSILSMGRDLKLETRDSFFKSLGKLDRELVGKVAALAEDRRFFHWDIEFPEVFYSFAGLADGRIERRKPGDSGFDAIVGNPPYDVLSEMENDEDLSGVRNFIANTPELAPSERGKNNLYKLFICKGLALLPELGQIGFIVPMGLLGLDQLRAVRERLFQRGHFLSVDAFPQKDDAQRRVFVEAKLSTAIFTYLRTSDLSKDDVAFPSRQHPENRIELGSPVVMLTGNEIPMLDPVNRVIVTSGPEDWSLARRVIGSGRMVRLGTVIQWFQGEINETVSREAGWLVGHSPHLVVRGAAICLYRVREASQGEDMFLDAKAYLQGKNADTKAFHHREPRLVMQNAAPQNNFRRLITAALSAGHFCSYKTNYCLTNSMSIDHRVVLAVLNSKLADWFFRLTSTSADINHYQLDNLPFPTFESRDYRNAPRPDLGYAGDRIDHVISTIADAPFPADVSQLLVDLVDGIIDIESSRGDISRSERSALAPDAQKLQAGIDRIMYRLAGLNKMEVAGLEDRLSRML
jgi:hypothetical protein